MLRRKFLSALGLGAIVVATASLVTDEAAAQRIARPGSWQLLGTQKVNFGVDRDIVRVGFQDGRFRAIKLRAIENDIEVTDVTVIYGNGEPDRLPVRHHLRRGTETAPIDLKGNTRAIKEIHFVYKSRPSFRGRAIMEVYGQH